MASPHPQIFLPVESQIRELDSKLLLACVAAERGYSVVLGAQSELRAYINRFGAGTVIAKGLAIRNARFLRNFRKLGLRCLAWDEEGLVHPEPKIYYARRVDIRSLNSLHGVFSWGPDYTRLLGAMPGFPGTPIFETGNPRIDVLRADVREFFAPDVDRLRQRYGRYILLNSNFGRVNPQVKRVRDTKIAFDKKAQSTLQGDWEAIQQHRMALFDHFREMFAALAKAFPRHKVILRPHPAERIETWRDIEVAHPNAVVIQEGNVVPWLLGADILVQNGCTTAIESVLLDKPVIAFAPVQSEKYDWHLPLHISHKVVTTRELIQVLHGHLDGTSPLSVLPAQRHLLDDFVSDEPRRLAADRIIDVIDGLEPPGGTAVRLTGHAATWMWRADMVLRRHFAKGIHGRAYQDRIFPDMAAADLAEKVNRFHQATGRFGGLSIVKLSPKMFRITGIDRPAAGAGQIPEG